MASDDGGNTRQKTFYPDEETADWIEETAKQSKRSESYFVSKIVNEVAESVDYETVKIHEYTFQAEEREEQD